MKFLPIITSLLFASGVFGQTSVKLALDSLHSIDDAEQFVQTHSNLQPNLQIHNSTRDTSDIDRQLQKRKKGDVLSLGNYTYKIVGDTSKYSFRASYIYLDGSKLSRADIDSIRKVILQRYATGTTFEELADKFNMDGNQKHGDLGIFESGMMMKEFEEAIRAHKDGDIFIVDVPDHQWYYVVKKTAPTQVSRELTVLEIKGK